ncbi:MAG: hypothetical protein H0V17_30050 [Deltaproteobacteria bacterium]|nr:hypothetical protein [Deltaproteobacteria bacterium]
MRIWFVFLVACAPDERQVDGDPRCASLCGVDEPPLAGAYDICSEDSSRTCFEQCESRIAGSVTGCSECLLQGAAFGGPIDASAECDPTGNCTVTGHGGSCTYRADDPADRDRCTRIAFPRREVSCPVLFDDARNCNGVCS